MGKKRKKKQPKRHGLAEPKQLYSADDYPETYGKFLSELEKEWRQHIPNK